MGILDKFRRKRKKQSIDPEETLKKIREEYDKGIVEARKPYQMEKLREWKKALRKP